MPVEEVPPGPNDENNESQAPRHDERPAREAETTHAIAMFLFRLNPKETPTDLWLQANKENEAGKFREAIFCAEMLLHILETAVQNPTLLFEAHMELAHALAGLLRHEEALDRLLKAYDLADSEPLKAHYAIRAAMHLQKTLTVMGRTDEAAVWDDRCRFMIRGRLEERQG